MSLEPATPKLRKNQRSTFIAELAMYLLHRHTYRYQGRPHMIRRIQTQKTRGSNHLMSNRRARKMRVTHIQDQCTRTRTQKNLNRSPHTRNLSTPNQKSHKPKTTNQIQLLIPRNHLFAHPLKFARSTLLYALFSPTRSGIYYLE
jgi:hypothetical protein